MVAVGGAETVSAAVHLVGLEGSGPRGGPEEKNGQEADGRSDFLSRSDRKVERRSHRF